MKRTALITGASKRIGKRITEFLAEREWNVILHYNSSSNEAVELASRLKRKYPKQQFDTVKTDLSKSNEVIGLIPKVVSEYGSFELLVNNASVFDRSYLVETSTELFDLQMDVNFKAPFFLIRDFANYCKTGHIVNFVDTRVTQNKSNFAAYSLSKKALWELTKMAALELAPDIRVNAIAPGATLAPDDEDESYLRGVAAKTPMRKPSGLNPIIDSIEYIIKNKHLTGQLLFADGGENLGINP